MEGENSAASLVVDMKLYCRSIKFVPADTVGPTFPWPENGHLQGFRFQWPPWSSVKVERHRMT